MELSSSKRAVEERGQPEPGATRRPPFFVVVGSLGIAQILAWGSTYYLPAVLAAAIVADTGWPPAWVVGGLSVGLLVSGLISPLIGGQIDRRGGRPVLAASAFLLAAGLVILGFSASLPSYIFGWSVIGLGMGAGLYDPAFSTLGRLYGPGARSAITYLTLVAGFSSTICWPATAYLAAHFGWRATCLSYAVVQIAIVLPCYIFGLPKEPARRPASAVPRVVAKVTLRPGQRLAFGLLAGGLSLAALVMTVIAVCVIALLQARGLGAAAAVGLGAMIGPSQVAARILEAGFGKRIHPIWGMIAASIAIATGLAMLLGGPGTIVAGVLLYGAGNGIRSITRGTVPLALFGVEGYPVVMGWLSLPVLVTQATAPSLGMLLMSSCGANGTILVLCGLSAINILLALALLPHALRPRTG